MESFHPSEERSSIRIAIDGEWSCQDFSTFLEHTNDVYRRLNSVFVLNQSLEQKTPGGHSTWHDSIFGEYPYHTGYARPSYLELIELSNAIVVPLQVDAISYGSPGWIQLLGNLNVLKLIADAMAKWRAENTRREADKLKSQTDRMRIQADLAVEILKLAGKISEPSVVRSSRLVDLAEEVIKPTSRYFERYGNDARVIDAKVVPVRRALPDRKGSRAKPPSQ